MSAELGVLYQIHYELLIAVVYRAGNVTRSVSYVTLDSNGTC